MSHLRDIPEPIIFFLIQNARLDQGLSNAEGLE